MVNIFEETNICSGPPTKKRTATLQDILQRAVREELLLSPRNRGSGDMESTKEKDGELGGPETRQHSAGRGTQGSTNAQEPAFNLNVPGFACPRRRAMWYIIAAFRDNDHTDIYRRREKRRMSRKYISAIVVVAGWESGSGRRMPCSALRRRL